MTVRVAPGEIVRFRRETGPGKWFAQDKSLDQATDRRFCRPTRLPQMASLRPGKKASRARSRWSICSISFRATCFAATRAPSRPMRRRAPAPIGRWRAALIRRQIECSGRFSICPSCIRKRRSTRTVPCGYGGRWLGRRKRAIITVECSRHLIMAGFHFAGVGACCGTGAAWRAACAARAVSARPASLPGASPPPG